MDNHADRKRGLPPVVECDTRVLVLGTLPGDESIRQQKYYADTGNHFWEIIYAALCGGAPPDDYCTRIEFLTSNGVGLWDVLESAIRDGSSDTRISEEVANDIPGFLIGHSRIERILLNGTKARLYFNRHCGNARIGATCVPSSSGTPGRNVLPVEGRIEKWREALGPSNKRIQADGAPLVYHGEQRRRRAPPLMC